MKPKPNYRVFPLGLVIDDGQLSIDHDTIADEDLASWTDNMMPEELLHGTVHIEVDAHIEQWDIDGPRIRIEAKP